jgi:hypothetical protein
MKSVLDIAIRKELQERITTLTSQHTPRWGKMNVHQMIEHCSRCEDMYHGKLSIKRAFLGRLLGTMMKKRILKNDMLFGRNAPTGRQLIISEMEGDIELQKKNWLKKIEQYSVYNNDNFVHPFFGPMTKEEAGVFVYKHIDHHLRQFGV